MKTKNLLFTALTALALTVLAGCSSETEFPQETPDTIPPGVARIEFAIKGVKTGTSYAAPTVDLEWYESSINDVTAYLFKLDGTDVLSDNSVVTDVLPATLNISGNGYDRGSFDLGKSTVETRYAVVFIANKACFNAALAGVSKTSNTTYATLNAIETLENTATMEGVRNNKGLPMRAFASVTVPVGGGKVAMDAKFARPLSRFDIDNRAVHSFAVESVKLKNGRKTSPINVPGTANVVDGSTPSDIDYTSFLSNVNEKLSTPNADGSNTQLRPAFYVSPALSADGASIEVSGELRVGAEYYPRTYTVPLINKDTQGAITLGLNKRYRLTLLMDKDDNVVGEIALDLGEWVDDGTDAPDVSPDLDLQVNTTGITGATYVAATRTFNAKGVTEFQFEMLNDASVSITTDGTVVTGVTTVTAPISRGVNATTYKVALGAAAGNGSFTFKKEGVETYEFKVVLEAADPSKYPGTDLAWIDVNGILWAPVNVGATKVGEQGTLFQYGRIQGWADATVMLAAKEEKLIPIADADKNPGICYVDGTSEVSCWWPRSETQESITALIDRWSAVSDGLNNPCPKGWRLPTKTEADNLIAGQSFIDDASAKTVTVRGLAFPCKERFSSKYDGSVEKSGGSYWLSVYYQGISVENGTITPFDYKGWGSETCSADGYSIRCVKDKPVAP